MLKHSFRDVLAKLYWGYEIVLASILTIPRVSNQL
jgi:hypothetical protein